MSHNKRPLNSPEQVSTELKKLRQEKMDTATTTENDNNNNNSTTKKPEKDTVFMHINHIFDNEQDLTETIQKKLKILKF